MTDPWPHDVGGEPMSPEEWAEQWRAFREKMRERKATYLREHGGCGHGLHQKYKIQGVGFVCIGCEPTWVPVEAPDAWPFSLLEHRPQVVTNTEWPTTRTVTEDDVKSYMDRMLPANRPRRP